MLRFKVEPMKLLKERGFSSVRLRREKTFGEATMQKMRHKEITSMNEFDKLCSLLDAQPGDLIEYVKTDPEEGGPVE